MAQSTVSTKIAAMQEGGAFASRLREDLLKSVYAGMKTQELEDQAKNFYESHNLTPSFLGYEGYPHRLVICVNDEIIHGMPSDRELQPGDLVTIDLGVFYKGFHTDTAKTIEVETNAWAHFLDVGREALRKAIAQAKVGNTVGHISSAMQKVVELNGYSVLRAYGGHGVGRNLHEDLHIPCYGVPGTGPRLTEGMTIAIEVMYMEGTFKINILDDGWTVVTKDGKQSAMFEHTVAITHDGALILTD